MLPLTRRQEQEKHNRFTLASQSAQSTGGRAFVQANAPRCRCGGKYPIQIFASLCFTTRSARQAGGLGLVLAATLGELLLTSLMSQPRCYSCTGRVVIGPGSTVSHSATVAAAETGALCQLCLGISSLSHGSCGFMTNPSPSKFVGGSLSTLAPLSAVTG